MKFDPLARKYLIAGNTNMEEQLDIALKLVMS
jgi:hypothetical protein